MKQMAHEEEKALAARKETVERELKVVLLPKDPNDEKSVLIEIRAGTQGWKVENIESSPSSPWRNVRSCRRDSGNNV